MALISFEDLGPKTYSTLYALDSFQTYWDESEQLIQKEAKFAVKRSGPTWIPQTKDEHEEFRWEQQLARQFQDEIMTLTLRYSTIVMLYVIIERELLRMVTNLDPSRSLGFERKGSSVLKPVANFCETNFNLCFQNINYDAMCDLQKIRDCIVHCRGDISLSRDAEYLIRLKRKRTGFHAWEETQLEIETDCIRQFLKEAWRFFIWLFGEFKWMIHDSWREKKWFSCHSV